MRTRLCVSAEWDSTLTGFERLIILKVLRQEKLCAGMARYVGELHGRNFQFPPAWRLEEIFPDTNCRTPIVFVLSTGADPTALLQRFAESMGMMPGEKLHMISLGQGQVSSVWHCIVDLTTEKTYKNLCMHFPAPSKVRMCSSTTPKVHDINEPPGMKAGVFLCHDTLMHSSAGSYRREHDRAGTQIRGLGVPTKLPRGELLDAQVGKHCGGPSKALISCA